MSESNLTYMLFDTPRKWFDQLYEDISQAKHSIFIETYRFNDDEVGKRFLSLLSRKCKEKVTVKLLVDSWGTNVNEVFFNPITKHGGEVVYFEKIKISWDFLSSNHQRSHRKIVVIDDVISHVGSANITAYSADWRETIVRMEGGIARTLKKTIISYIKNAENQFYKRLNYKRNIKYQDFLIIQDFPSIYKQKVKVHYERIIHQAKTEITIVTPYFLPGYKIRRRLIMAAKKGIKINVFIPFHSDVTLADHLRDKYLGVLSRAGIKIWMYTPHNLHAKIIVIDHEKFVFGSTNFDYRSFRYMHEIMIQGKDPVLCQMFNKFISETLKDCISFDYEKWKNRSRLHKIIGWLLIPFRHLL